MKEGDIKGAFVVTAPLDDLTKSARANTLALLLVRSLAPFYLPRAWSFSSFEDWWSSR